MNGGSVNSVRFNQDSSRFACGLDNGFVLFNSSPLKQILRVDLDKSIGLVEMLYRCNVVALVGSNKEPTFDANKVILFDCCLHKIVVELNAGSPVKNVLMRRDRLIIVVESRIFVYTLTDIPELLFSIQTIPNFLGLCSVSHNDSNPIIAFPAKDTGHVGILSLNQPQRKLKIFHAHNHSLQAISVNLNGNLIATASSKGTLINLFDAQTTNIVREFRRGINNATISCISFAKDSSSICVSSHNRKTIHVFNVAEKAEQTQSLFQRYFNNRSATHICLYTQNTTDQSKNSSTQCTFVGRSVAVIDLNTNYYKFDVNLSRMSCLEWTHKLFMNENGKSTD
ncbi:WD repeat domain phosphoinositide-interacting protein 3 [Aphelenchoides bicaudatus]|nr:WD repeat domain phosphoinositide-interacting protein 3 [Aphelenchoides bicaudatus]